MFTQKELNTIKKYLSMAEATGDLTQGKSTHVLQTIQQTQLNLNILPNQLMSRQEVAEYMHCHPNHINKLVRIGKLKKNFPGSRKRQFLPEDVFNCMQNKSI